jgi:hypothetical protein
MSKLMSGFRSRQKNLVRIAQKFANAASAKLSTSGEVPTTAESPTAGEFPTTGLEGADPWRTSK